jgi:hypothetical protein
MEITKKEIERFQQIWREELEEEISEDEVRAQIRKLDALYVLLRKGISN